MESGSLRELSGVESGSLRELSGMESGSLRELSGVRDGVGISQGAERSVEWSRDLSGS